MDFTTLILMDTKVKSLTVSTEARVVQKTSKQKNTAVYFRLEMAWKQKLQYVEPHFVL